MAPAGLCAAIAARRFVQFRYNDRWRVAYPCAHGWLPTGNEGLRAHEVRLVNGRLRTLPGRMYLVSRLDSLTVTDQEFDTPPPGYRRGDRGMTRIHCEL